MPPATPETRTRALLTRLAEVAFACTRSNDLAALADVAAETCREAVGGMAWRLLTINEDSGALGLGAVEDGGAAVLPEPGGVLEWMLAHEDPVHACADRASDPTLEHSLWPEGAPGAVMAWPLHSGERMRGVLVVALVDSAAPDAMGVTTARIACDQLALALERHALAAAHARQSRTMAQVEERAQTGEALFSELIAVVAHEIRTPLTSIKAYTESLIDAPDTAFEQRRSFLTVIDEECDRLARLVSDALDLSRLEAGHRALKLKPMTSAAFVADLLSTIEPEAARHGVRLESDLGTAQGPLPGVFEGDPDLLKQLALNLLGNALKFSPKGASVTIRACALDGDWQLDIIDAGVGIPEDQLNRVFERFYRVELRGGRRVPGTGLGLAIARHIVDLHGGRIWAENAPGGGSIFSVRLPVRQLAPESVCFVARSLGGRGDVQRLLDAAVEMIGDAMAAEIVSVLLVDPEAGDLRVSASRGLDESVHARHLPYRGGVAGAAIRAGQPLLVNDVETDRRIHMKSHPQYFTKSLLCAPIEVSGETIGVVNVNNKVSRSEFDEADRTLLATLVSRLTAMLERAHAYPDASSVVDEACESLQALARSRRDLFAGRRELARYAFEVARRLGLEPAEGTRIAWLAGAAAEHGHGAVAVDPAEPGEVAARLAILVARGERMDGTGWPRGLAGSAIPLSARILGVLDGFEALTGGRAYRTALPVEAALAALEAQAARAWDPRVLAALRATLEQDGRLDGRRAVA